MTFQILVKNGNCTQKMPAAGPVLNAIYILTNISIFDKKNYFSTPAHGKFCYYVS